MVNQYETVFILTPVLSEDQVKEAVNDYEKILKTNGGEIVNSEKWGMRKLAYPIQKKSTGFYNLFQYKIEGQFIDKLEIQMKRDERILRFLSVKLDKHAIAYSQKRLLRNKAAKEEKKTDK